jgi:hypothetical protein
MMHAVLRENKSIDEPDMSRLDEDNQDAAELSTLKFSSEEEMKEWFWEQHKEEIMTRVKQAQNRGGGRLKSPLWAAPGNNNNNNEAELESSRKSLQLLDFIAKVQRQFMQQEEVCVLVRLVDCRVPEDDGHVFFSRHGRSSPLVFPLPLRLHFILL